MFIVVKLLDCVLHTVNLLDLVLRLVLVLSRKTPEGRRIPEGIPHADEGREMSHFLVSRDSERPVSLQKLSLIFETLCPLKV